MALAVDGSEEIISGLSPSLAQAWPRPGAAQRQARAREGRGPSKGRAKAKPEGPETSACLKNQKPFEISRLLPSAPLGHPCNPSALKISLAPLHHNRRVQFEIVYIVLGAQAIQYQSRNYFLEKTTPWYARKRTLGEHTPSVTS